LKTVLKYVIIKKMKVKNDFSTILVIVLNKFAQPDMRMSGFFYQKCKSYDFIIDEKSKEVKGI